MVVLSTRSVDARDAAKRSDSLDEFLIYGLVFFGRGSGEALLVPPLRRPTHGVERGHDERRLEVTDRFVHIADWIRDEAVVEEDSVRLQRVEERHPLRHVDDAVRKERIESGGDLPQVLGFRVARQISTDDDVVSHLAPQRPTADPVIDEGLTPPAYCRTAARIRSYHWIRFGERGSNMRAANSAAV